MRIIKDILRRNNADLLTINFLLEKEEYKPYARKILTLNNDSYIGRRIFRIDVVDKSEFSSLPLEGANVVVRLATDPDENASYAVATFDFSLPKKKLLPELKEIVVDLYQKDISIAQEVLNKYKELGDAEGCETFSNLIELLNATQPREDKPITSIACRISDSSLQERDEWLSNKPPTDHSLFSYHPLSGLSEDELRIIRTTKDILGIKKKEQFGKKVNLLLKLLAQHYGLTTMREEGNENEENESSLGPERDPTLSAGKDDAPESGESLIQIIPYEYNLINSTCDFYFQTNGIGRILKVVESTGNCKIKQSFYRIQFSELKSLVFHVVYG